MNAYDPFIVIWTARDIVHAHLMVTELASVGIEAQVTQEHLNALWMMGPSVAPGIEVRERHVERATKVLQELEDRLRMRRQEQAQQDENPQPRAAVELPYGLRRIVSGGQTGADQAALLWAAEHGVPTGGWVPMGRLAEDGEIPVRIQGLVEAESNDPAVRTRLNVRDSDATLILSMGPLTGGSALTLRRARELARPVLHLELGAMTREEAVAELQAWLAETRPERLNVAGPRASKEVDVGRAVVELLDEALLGGGTSSAP
jgi:hypothetical protein